MLVVTSSDDTDEGTEDELILVVRGRAALGRVLNEVCTEVEVGVESTEVFSATTTVVGVGAALL